MAKKLVDVAPDVNEDVEAFDEVEETSEVSETVKELVRLSHDLTTAEERYNQTYQALIEALVTVEDPDSEYDMEQALDRFVPTLHLLDRDVKNISSEIVDEVLPGLADEVEV